MLFWQASYVDDDEFSDDSDSMGGEDYEEDAGCAASEARKNAEAVVIPLIFITNPLEQIKRISLYFSEIVTFLTVDSGAQARGIAENLNGDLLFILTNKDAHRKFMAPFEDHEKEFLKRLFTEFIERSTNFMDGQTQEGEMVRRLLEKEHVELRPLLRMDDASVRRQISDRVNYISRVLKRYDAVHIPLIDKYKRDCQRSQERLDQFIALCESRG